MSPKITKLRTAKNQENCLQIRISRKKQKLKKTKHSKINKQNSLKVKQSSISNPNKLNQRKTRNRQKKVGY